MEQILATAEHLCLTYGAVTAVKDVSFFVRAGEILAVIGPNGSGKTSAVECLEGLRRPSGGRAELFGCDPYQNRRRVFQKIGAQLQASEYPDKIKVKELCSLFSSFYENPADWRLLLEQFGLSEKAGRTVNRLSGGEKQRLSILLALLGRPQLLFLDELTTGLDPEVRHGMWDSLKQIRQAGAAILLVSHYMDEVAQLADRLVYLEQGRSLFTGTQQEFLAYAAGRSGRSGSPDGLSLEDAYLLLSPQASRMDLRAVY